MYELVDAKYNRGYTKLRELTDGDFESEFSRNSFYLKDGRFCVRDGFAEPEILLTFRDEKGILQKYDAYRQIKAAMVPGTRLTEKRRKIIVETIASIALVSLQYEPAEWTSRAVRVLHF